MKNLHIQDIIDIGLRDESEFGFLSGFKAKETKEKKFHINRSKVVKKPMMHLVQTLYYRANGDMDIKMIELPYKELNFRMIVVLPNKVDGLPRVLEKASEKGLLEDIFKMRDSGSKIILDMPKFEIRTKIILKDVLQKLGVSSSFESGSQGIVKERSVRVSKALQEAFIKVDEEGAIAGAITRTF